MPEDDKVKSGVSRKKKSRAASNAAVPSASPKNTASKQKSETVPTGSARPTVSSSGSMLKSASIGKAQRRTPPPSIDPASRQTLSSAEKNWSVVIFAGGIIAAAFVVFFAVQYQTTHFSSNGPAVQSGPAKDPILAQTESKADFQTWLSKWQTLDPYVNENEFTLESSGVILTATSAGIAAPPDPSVLQSPLANRYVWSPDNSMFLDYVADYGEPGSSLRVYGRDGRGLLETLASCGPSCELNGAFWSDASHAVVLGSAADLNADGTPFCIRNQTSVGDQSQRCYRHLTLTAYDFSADQQRTYISEKHSFATDPFAADVLMRWISGMNAADQAALAGSQQVIDLRGSVISVAADAGIIGVSDSNHQVWLAAVLPDAVIRDATGAPIGLSGIAVGSQAELMAAKNDKGALTAMSVSVVCGPAVTVTLTAPTDGSVVHRRFTVSGTASVSAGKVSVRVTDQRSQKSVGTVEAQPDATKGGAFAGAIDLDPHGVVKGDTLHVDAVPEANASAASAQAGLNVLYRP
jgi:hypothetical protein